MDVILEIYCVQMTERGNFSEKTGQGQNKDGPILSRTVLLTKVARKKRESTRTINIGPK